MFEHFTEKARRVIFFARYEAGQYGSPFIETEHLLLGLLREDDAFVLRFLRPNSRAADFRTQVERQITSRERISTSMEIPLTHESKDILDRAKEEAGRLGHRWIGTGHLLLGIFASETSFAARLLQERGAKVEAIREFLAARAPETVDAGGVVATRAQGGVSRLLQEAGVAVESFLAALRSCNSEHLAAFFTPNSQFVDCTGKRWSGRAEIEKQFEVLFSPYAKKNASWRDEGFCRGPSETILANIVWENLTVPGQPPQAMHRMTLVLAAESMKWTIYLLQVTPIISR